MARLRLALAMMPNGSPPFGPLVARRRVRGLSKIEAKFSSRHEEQEDDECLQLVYCVVCVKRFSPQRPINSPRAQTLNRHSDLRSCALSPFGTSVSLLHNCLPWYSRYLSKEEIELPGKTHRNCGLPIVGETSLVHTLNHFRLFEHAYHESGIDDSFRFGERRRSG